MSQPATPAAAPAAVTTAPVAEPSQAAQQPTTPATPATEPVTTPPAAPAAPAPEAIGEPAAETTPTVAYRETGDPGLDLALDFMGRMGLGPEHDAIKAAAEGNFDKLEATLAAMGDKAAGYERYLALSKDAYTKSDTATKAKQTAVTTAVHEIAGGAEQWTAIKTWAGTVATPEEKAEINAMLEAGPVQAKAAAQMLLGLYKNAAGTTVNPDPVTDTAGNPSTAATGALPPAEYAAAVRELRGQLGSRMEASPQYAALRARRLAWRG